MGRVKISDLHFKIKFLYRLMLKKKIKFCSFTCRSIFFYVNIEFISTCDAHSWMRYDRISSIAWCIISSVRIVKCVFVCLDVPSSEKFGHSICSINISGRVFDFSASTQGCSGSGLYENNNNLLNIKRYLQVSWQCMLHFNIITNHFYQLGSSFNH